MSLFNNIANLLSDNSNKIKEAVYIKDFSERNKELEQLENIVDSVSDEDRKEIEQKINLLKYGIYGEKCVNYELKNSRMPILIMHDLYLEYRGYSSQIDFIIISKKFILILECKNTSGNITVTDNGEFVRSYIGSFGKVYKKESLYSPVTQNEKHIAIIKDILENEKVVSKKHLDIVKSLIVVANPKSFVNTKYAPKDIKKQIIRCDKLINEMKCLVQSDSRYFALSYNEMYDIANTLMKYNKNNHISTDISKYKIKLNNEFVSNKALIDALKKYRLKKSREEGNKPYFVFNDKELSNIVALKPKSVDDLKKIKGFGNVKCERYGEDIVDIVRENQ